MGLLATLILAGCTIFALLPAGLVVGTVRSWFPALSPGMESGPVTVAFVVLTAGSLLGLVSAALCVWERLDEPTAWDHLRHCLLLYPVVLLGGFFLLNMPPGLEHGIVHGVVFVTWTVTLSGVLSNALVLGGYHIRRSWWRG